MNLEKIHNIYFIGIGGIGMSALARYFHANEKQVAGYDKTKTPLTQDLESASIQIHYEDNTDLIHKDFLNSENTLIVYTPAIPISHKELQFFKDNNFIVLKRAEVLGIITKNTFCFAVAGTHGKTTTSTILGHIMAAKNGTAFLGGISENYKSNLILGGDKISVVEADEFDRSFLQLSPNIACITSMDADHLDIYGHASELQKSFEDFSRLVDQKLIVANGLSIQGTTYGLEDNSDFSAQNLRIINGDYVFDVVTPDDSIEDVVFSLPGRHNIMNAMAALAMASSYGVDLNEIKDSLATFQGVERRFTYKIRRNDFVLIDDYAHHPTEINAVANSIKEMYPNQKSLVVFQPHLFSRTKDFGDDFARSLEQFDEVVLLEIYPARELPIEGINSHWLLDKIRSENKKVTSKSSLVSEMKKSKAKVMAMLGAGDIGLMVDEVSKQFQELQENNA